MFDDIPSTTPAKGSTPSNLPIGEPEDMFSAVDTMVQSEEAPPRAQQPDIVMPAQSVEEGVDRSPMANTSAVSAGILKPKMSTPVPKPQSYDDHLDALTSPEMARESAPRGSRMIFIVIACVCVVGLIGGVAYLVYSMIFAPNDETVEPGVIAPTSTTAGQIPNDTGITADQVIGEESDREVLFGAPIDSDEDGIDDSIEKTIGTDVQKKDTDADGLSDGDEILVWKTNPLNADTDGDTYPDGTEVTSGYSPLGPGKLFTTPSSTPTSTAMSATSTPSTTTVTGTVQ